MLWLTMKMALINHFFVEIMAGIEKQICINSEAVSIIVAYMIDKALVQ